VRGLFTALADPAGVIAHRPGALERVALARLNVRLERRSAPGRQSGLCESDGRSMMAG
jgi:hypothetical protein